jgi:hypothetical protein
MSLAVLGILGQTAVFALVALAARQTTSRAKAVALGIAVGVAGTFLLGFLTGFLGHVLPVGQMDFWFAQQIARLH